MSNTINDQKTSVVQAPNAPKNTSKSRGQQLQSPSVDSKAQVVEHDEIKIIQVVSKKPSPEWLKSLYDPNLLTIDELTSIYDSVRYIGFDRLLMLYKLQQLVPDQKTAVQIIIACALRGPQAASELVVRGGRSIKDIGIPGSGKMGTEDLSCQRIASSTADLAAYYLKKLNVPKRIERSSCPAWLQFPTAGSIKLPDNLRQQHIEFSKDFSTLIGGVFRVDIYDLMMRNAYLDDALNLFE